ncbi:uncharacterized protein HD556DRAFT_293844 [Suillus plorans]|uniref:Uncharacterized protein n=1 Tax=Suillus plorans TaxID=116603 RepID=A0A9P7AVE1_9AGAM|nr:uncharacterized protein HD556DRAFT_293844 [Suillus plorans]KAG1796307.1 hypothetical protein HD556DRAFT_293844 [Suillus plorans]
MREEFILRLSVKKIFLICRIIQLLFSSGESLDPTFGKSTLVQSFVYLVVLLFRANNTVPVLHQALHSYAFEIAMGIQGPAVEVDLRDYKKSFLVILDIFLVYDKILTYAYKRVDAWSNALGPDVLPDETIRKRWSAVETKIRLYASLKSREEKIRRPSPDKKGWILRNSVTVVIPQKILSLGNARNVRLCGTAQSDASVIPGIVITNGAANF